MVTVCTWLFFAATWLTGVAHPDVEQAAHLLGVRVVARAARAARLRGQSRARSAKLHSEHGDRRCWATLGRLVAEKLLRHPEYGVNLVGFVDSEPKEQRPTLSELTILGTPDRLQSIIRTFDIERVIIAFSRDSHEHMLAMIRSLKDPFVQVDIVSRYFELIGPSAGISTVEGVPVCACPLAPSPLPRGF